MSDEVEYHEHEEMGFDIPVWMVYGAIVVLLAVYLGVSFYFDRKDTKAFRAMVQKSMEDISSRTPEVLVAVSPPIGNPVEED